MYVEGKVRTSTSTPYVGPIVLGDVVEGGDGLEATAWLEAPAGVAAAEDDGEGDTDTVTVQPRVMSASGRTKIAPFMSVFESSTRRGSARYGRSIDYLQPLPLTVA